MQNRYLHNSLTGKVESSGISPTMAYIIQGRGLQWCVETDAFNFRMEICQKTCTRRGMLSVSSLVYDPLGFLAPFVLPAEIMILSSRLGGALNPRVLGIPLMLSYIIFQMPAKQGMELSLTSGC